MIIDWGSVPVRASPSHCAFRCESVGAGAGGQTAARRPGIPGAPGRLGPVGPRGGRGGVRVGAQRRPVFPCTGLIDVIWLRRNSYVAAFEIEATTSIISGLARMGDLVALVPNLDLPFFIVAPEAKRGRVFEQITRPLFSLGLTIPLHRRCRFISFETLLADLERLGATTTALDASRYLDTIAEETDELRRVRQRD